MGLFGNKKSDEHSNGATKSDAREGSTEPPATVPHMDRGSSDDDGIAAEYGASSADYGIAEATKLMRSLPQDNSDLVVRVMVATLESVNVSISRLIEDANATEKQLETTVATLNKEIKDFEKEIAERKDKIRALEDELKQTSVVRERLVQAERARTARVGPAPKPAEGRPDSGSGFRVAPLRPGGS